MKGIWVFFCTTHAKDFVLLMVSLRTKVFNFEAKIFCKFEIISQKVKEEFSKAKDFYRHFSKEERQMANKRLKRCSKSLLTREVQIKTTMRYHIPSIRMTMKERKKEREREREGKKEGGREGRKRLQQMLLRTKRNWDPSSLLIEM